MIALKNNRITQEFIVVHPLFDKPEQKRNGSDLGMMRISKGTRATMIVLRIYLTLMSLLLTFHLLDLAGVFGRTSGH